MTISPDEIIYSHLGPLPISATLVFTWLVMLVLTLASWLVTRKVTSDTAISNWQNLLEVVVSAIRDQIREVSSQEAARYVPFIGTIFLFITASNILAIIPGYYPPTGSFSTTAALALLVFFAVPAFGISRQGLGPYLKNYTRPTIIMLPFNVIGEISRTLALAVRLYGNMMSGTVIIAILLGIVPLFFPVIMQVLGLLTGIIQAYIFAILAMVYISSASQNQKIKGK